MNNDSPYAPKASGSLTMSVETSKRSLLLLVLSALLATCIAMGMLITQHSFKDLFLEFGINSPAVNRLATHPVLPLLLLFAVAVTIAKEFVAKLRPFANALNVGLICLALTCASVYVCGIVIPIVELIHDLGR